ncbi:MAG: formylglycine-generating enzyme family protein [Treponema sp.]|nr:formylglycine-generating enzyme family protein [Treponema sp.]
MKRFLLTLIILAAGFILTAQTKFSHISMVNFKNNLTFTIGEDVQSFTAKRTLKPFSINKFETTYGLWYQIRVAAEKQGYVFQNPGQAGSHGKRGAAPTDDNDCQPVTMISWYDAIIWCNALSEIKGRTPCYTFQGDILRDSNDTAVIDICECNWNADGFRLPSESEWEFASRKTKGSLMPGNLISGQPKDSSSEEGLLYAWTSENSGATKIVGTAGLVFDPFAVAQPATGNPDFAGLYDMCGNILEFCWDWFADYEENQTYGPAEGYERVSRGGSWSPYTMFSYCGDRYSFDPNECYNYFGFRLASSILPD